jgi:gamma-glutamyltranspeptidase
LALFTPSLSRTGRLALAGLAVVCALIAGVSGARATLAAREAGEDVAAVRDPAWAPDSRRLAVSLYDRIVVQAVGGKVTGPIVTWNVPVVAERDPAWSRDGSRLAFAADTGNGFDLYVVEARGGTPRRVTSLPGDERWPSWTPDGRIVCAVSDGSQWDLAWVDPNAPAASGPGDVRRLTDSPVVEREPAVSPDGARIAFASNRDNEDGDLDIWVMTVPPRGSGERMSGPEPERLLQVRGDDHRPSWAPEGDRLVFSAVRDGVGTLWVVGVPASAEPGATAPRERPQAPPVLLSRQPGLAAWSPDGRTIAVTSVPPDEPGYNGNPLRDRREAPPLFAGDAAFKLRMLPAPRRPDQDARAVALAIALEPATWGRLFDRVWSTLEGLYYRSGPSAEAWRALARKYRSDAAAAADAREFEDVIDRLLLEQPLIKAPVSSSGAIVVSGHRLASEAGVSILEQGGNIVDAAIAVSFALGVVEPDASGLGGDGMAILYQRGMPQPVVIDYKDQAPIHATLDNPLIMRDGRLVADGPAAANIPGVVAGMDLLHRRYGSGRLSWADLMAPAIALAERGFVLDEALPTTIAEGRGFFEKYPASARVFLPGGRVPRPGDRFVNADYGRTLRVLAAEGADAFYRGSLARRIAEDVQRNGGLIGVEDLAQYRAIERAPLTGRFRGHVVYAAPPPVASGAALVEALQILDHYRPTGTARVATDPDYLHYLIESWKARDPIRRIADPALWPVDLEHHLDPAHAAQRFQRISRTAALGLEPNVDDPRDDPRQQGQGERIGRGTTAFVVADVSGDMIAVTQTLSTWGGTFYVSDGLGFLYNNHLRSHRTRAGAYGQLLPMTRSSSTSAPTLVFRQTTPQPVPWFALGAAGNAWITASVYSLVAAIVDGGLTAQEAIEAPRFLVTRDPTDPLGTGAQVQIEDRVPRTTLESLEARGQRFVKIGRKGEVRYGYAAAAVVDPSGEQVHGASEPRRSHAAVAWTRRPATGDGRTGEQP